jgi:hypothetical protein
LNGRKIWPTGRTADQAIVGTALPSTVSVAELPMNTRLGLTL